MGVSRTAMTWLELVVAAGTMLVGATLQGSIGFGMGLLASPVLVLIDARFVPAPILLATLVLTTLLVWRERGAVDTAGLRWAVTGRVGGTVVAGTLLAVVPADRMGLLFGTLVLLAVLMSVSGWRLRPTRGVLAAAGALSGIMGTIASIGGPPMALVYQDAGGARLRATMSGFFWIGTVMSLAVLRAVGRFGAYEMRLAAILLPSMIGGYALSRWTKGVVDRRATRGAVLTVAGAAGIVVVARAIGMSP